MLLLGVVVIVLAVLVVLGVTGGDDNAGQEAASTTPTETTAKKAPKREREKPAAPRRVVLRIAPADATYVCVDTGVGTPVRFEGTLQEPRTFRGRHLRINLGNTSVVVTVNGKAMQLEPSTDPVGFDFKPRSQQPIPLGERPCA